MTVCERCPFADIPNLGLGGAGDLVHRITHATGLSSLAHAVENLTGIECGCAKRLRELNLWFPFGAKKNPNGNWAVAVTTAPRTHPYLQSCVASLVRNKLSPWIFAEPDSNLDGCEPFTITRNEKTLGAWYNWVNACETILRETDAEYILTVQDDAEFVDGTREWVEANWPDDWGMLSLYSSAKYHQEGKHGWKRIGAGLGFHGALACVFRREVLREMLDHPFTNNWRGHHPGATRQREGAEVGNVDAAIGMAMRRMGKRVFVTVPSLCQHIAETSAMNHGGNTGNRRAAVVGVPKEPEDVSDQIEHFILTRAAYDPTSPVFVRARQRQMTDAYLADRMRLFRNVCSASLDGQTRTDFTWLILVSPNDPTLDEKREIAESMPFRTELVTLNEGEQPNWTDDGFRSQWGRIVESRASKPLVLTSRIDDDDAVAKWFVEKLRLTCRFGGELAYMFPNGLVYNNGTLAKSKHNRNQFVSLLRKRENFATVMDVKHGQIEQLANVYTCYNRRSWLWVRHELAKSTSGRFRGNANLSELESFSIDLEAAGLPCTNP